MFINKNLFFFLSFILIINKIHSSELIQHNNHNNSFSVLSWNIKMFANPYGWLHNSIERTEKIIDTLRNHTKYDLILFQEAFSIKIRKKIFNALIDIYPNQIETIDNINILKNNSGLWAISSIPIKLIDNIIFSDLKHFDWFSSKGAHLYLIEKNNQEFFIINTHMQADYKTKYDEIRLKQYMEINNKLILPIENIHNPILLCGDLNISNKLKLKQMLNSMNLVNGPLLGNIKHSIVGNKQILLDYILVKKTKFKFESFERKILNISNKIELSDHYPIEAIMKW